MKKIIRYYSLFLVLMMVGFAAQAKEQTAQFKVYGNCGMCKGRIEKAAKAAGALTAKWDKESHMMLVTFEDTQTTEEKIQKGIAAVGHDTDLFEAKDKVYKGLPECCLYDRKKPGEKPV
jgi:hypothetical protein